MVSMDHILHTNDGFRMVTASISDMLLSRGIDTLPDSDGKHLECRSFFDDWFLFAVPEGNAFTCGLLKMREQEHELDRGIPADGDTPGVTVSFISFDTNVLEGCSFGGSKGAKGSKL